MNFFKSLVERASNDPKVVLLPEVDKDEDGTIREAIRISKERRTAKTLGITSEIINEAKSSGKLEEFVDEYQRLSPNLPRKGAERMLVRDPIAFSLMMVRLGYADAMVGGRFTKSGNVMALGKKIVGEEPGKIVSSIYFKEPPEGYALFDLIAIADMVVNPNPNPDELCKIILTSAESFETLTGKTPRIALLSYVTGDPTGTQLTDPEISKIAETLKKYNEEGHDYVVFQSQLDAAIKPEVAKSKNAPFTDRPADILVCPHLIASNPMYKCFDTLINGGDSMLYTQGFNHPVMDLSRGDSASNIANSIAAASLAAQGSNRTINDHFLEYL